MVTLTKYGASCNELVLFLEGLSTDTKPIGFFNVYDNNGTFITKKVIENGSRYTEIDTGKEFAYDAENETWYEDSSGGGGGGGGGTSNYNDLSNRPSVNNTVLAGNKTSAQLGLASSEQGGKADSAIQGVKLNSGSAITPDANNIVDITVGKSDVGLGNVTNDAQVKKISSSTSGDIVTWSGTSGDTVADSGVSIETSITDSDLKIPTSKAVDTALSGKVDKETGKGLSTNDYTTAEKTKLAGIAEGAEVNVQSDWNQTTTNADDYIKNKPTLGTAAAKNATDTYNSTGDDVTTGKAVAAALATLPEPMIFKGSLGTGGTITTLPTASSSNKGYVYKVITAGTYASQTAKVGDTFISDGSVWVLIPSGDEPSGTVTNVAVANSGGLTVSGSPITSSGTITVGHSNSVTAKTSSSLKKFTYDAYGHVTGSSELSTAESDALASGIDSTKVEQINTNQTNIGKVQTQANWNTNNGVKNLLDVTYNTYTNNECSYVKNADGSITLTISSTVAANRQLNLTGKIDNIYDGMIINGSPTGYATGDIEYLITGLKSDGTYENEQFSYNGAESTINRGTPKIQFAIFVKSGVTARTVTFYPMVREVGDSTYQPYSLPNTKITPELIELVDSGAKNLVNSTSGTGTRWIDIPVDISAGEYAVSFATLSTTWEVEANQLQVSFFDSNYDLVTDSYTYIDCTTKNGVYKLNDTCKVIRLYASPTSISGKVVTYTNMMLCSKAAWDVSQKYVPYRPSYEETVEQVAENKNNILITDITSSFTAATGFTKSTLSKVYKQGKHVFGTLIIKIDSGTIATAETTIATIASTDRPAAGYTAFCGFGTSEYNIRSIGSAYLAPTSGEIIATDYATTNSVCNINIDYCTA